ncbi:hypothetical protein NDU88_011946 [Pleurodeles waltl]|uniref:Uncharacterized protein n=1 Tax=Pleurodeles waltl TaxID=8319 RepID=A0AAV7R2K4_PLEWA|nr:hypothetical protein NDU88_011946 [Pleurodeles waltl]
MPGSLRRLGGLSKVDVPPSGSARALPANITFQPVQLISKECDFHSCESAAEGSSTTSVVELTEQGRLARTSPSVTAARFEYRLAAFFPVSAQPFIRASDFAGGPLSSLQATLLIAGLSARNPLFARLTLREVRSLLCRRRSSLPAPLSCSVHRVVSTAVRAQI